jgi:hypothetical protein
MAGQAAKCIYHKGHKGHEGYRGEMMVIQADGHYRVVNRGSGEKCYRAGFTVNGFPRWSSKTFRRATEAEEYGKRVIERYRRLRDYALAVDRPHKTEEF